MFDFDTEELRREIESSVFDEEFNADEFPEFSECFPPAEEPGCETLFTL